MKKGKLLRLAVLFFVFMFCFTVLSRAADQMGIAVVQTERPQSRSISHDVRASGRIVQNQELAVTTEPDQRVRTIYVSEGERVAEGDLLFEVDTDLLAEEILNQEQELEKQQLQVDDAKSQKDVSAQQKANAQAQASENYSLAVSRANVQLSRAKQQLTEAQDALKEYRKESGKNTESEDSAVEDSLEQTVEEKSEAYIQAEQELTSLQWTIENAVNQALLQGDSATLTANEAVRTQAGNVDATDSDGLPEGEQDVAADPNGSLYAADITDGGDGEPDDTYVASDSVGVFTDEADIIVEDDEADIIVEDIDIVPDGTGTQGGSEAQDNTQTQDSVGTQDNSDVQDSAGTQGDTEAQDSSGTQDSSAAAADPVRTEQEVREQYAQALQEARDKVEAAKQEKEQAEAALAQYQQERLASETSENAQTEKQLIANVEAAREAYEDAAISANEAQVTNGRAVQEAGIPNASDSSDRMAEIAYEQMELSLQKLEKLQENDGKIYAPADGLVTKINITTGEKTTDTTAILMADLSKGYRFTAELTKDQEQYIGTGDLVTLSGSSQKNKLEELPVESVTEDEEDEEVYHVTVQIPDGTFEIGMTATLEFSKKSETYATTVPVSALHLDEKNQAYVLVPDEYDSVMGTELQARKVSVTVLEKNELYAALADGSVTGSQEVITGSDKTVDNGSRVRIES